MLRTSIAADGPRWVLLCVSLVFGLLAGGCGASEPPKSEHVYQEARQGKGELRYIGDVPVMILAGSPEEMGRQRAALTGELVAQLSDYPKRLVSRMRRDDQWSKAVEQAKSLLPQFPVDHAAELRAFAEKVDIDRDLGIVVNTLVDLYRGGLGCTSLIVDPQRSDTGAPLFGRNLDFYSLGMLDKYGLVTVCRPNGKHAFASIGFPGLCGSLSGINDAGLALAVHEIGVSRDGAPLFNPKGVPYTLAFRRVLEECTTIEEAEKLLREMPRTTLLSLAVCDREHGGVIELTPKSVVMRRDSSGICPNTNHFRSPELSVLTYCRRYTTLLKAKSIEKLTIDDVAQKLKETHQGRLTLQTMIFEPRSFVVHLSLGNAPSSAQPLERIELKPLLSGERPIEEVRGKR